ncbi:MAG: oligosaccharide flippase family protein, partial [Candidatus Helarchaeota archaeon]
NVGVVYFQKELEFNKQFIYITAGTVTDFAVAVTAAILMRSVWALLFGLVAGKLAQLIVSYIIHPYKPKISMDFHKVRELFGFGKWVLAGSIIIFFLLQGDDFFVGKLIGVTALGFYQMAYKISNSPATEISEILSSVTFPAYSKIQSNVTRLRQYYFDILKFISFLSFPLSALILTLSPEFTYIFLGEKWKAVIPLIQILSLYGLFRALNATLGPLLYARGRPKILTTLCFWQLVFLAIIIYPCFRLKGLIGVSIAVTLSNLFCYICGLYFIRYLLECRIKDMLSKIIGIALKTGVIICIIYLIKYFSFGSVSNELIFIMSGFSAVVIYILMNFEYMKELKNNFRLRILNKG